MNRDRFPGLRGGWARLDGPAGTQPLDASIEAIAGWMRSGDTANTHGVFAAGQATSALADSARVTVGRALGADPRGVVFGPSMTALTFAFAAAVGRTMQPGQQVVCTRLDHDANVAPWLIAAQRAGARVRFAEPADRDALTLPAASVEAVLDGHTRWVAVTAASNAVGTVPDLQGIVAAAHEVGALVFVDAVHHAPHRPIDVAALGCDALVCSSYKWFGPHQGILWARPELLRELQPDKLRPSSDGVPERWEIGTPSFEALAGVRAAAEYLLELDWEAVRAHEDMLLRAMLDGLGAIDGVTLYGRAPDRTPTVLFTVEGHSAEAVAVALAEREVAVWHGNFYALELSRYLGLEPDGGVRAGCVHYNDLDDVDRLVEAVKAVAA